MAKSSLRERLHDPDYWLGPEDPPWYLILASIGYGLVGIVLSIVGIVGLVGIWWLIVLLERDLQR